MKIPQIPKYKPENTCPKCGFSFTTMLRQFFSKEHDIMENKEIMKCKVVGEHLHLECCCGYEIIVRPMDWKQRGIDK